MCISANLLHESSFLPIQTLHIVLQLIVNWKAALIVQKLNPVFVITCAWCNLTWSCPFMWFRASVVSGIQYNCIYRCLEKNPSILLLFCWKDNVNIHRFFQWFKFADMKKPHNKLEEYLTIHILPYYERAINVVANYENWIIE